MRRGQQFNCWDQDDLLRWKFVFGKPMQFWCTRFSGRLRHPLFQLLALLTPMFRGLCPDIAPGVVPRHCSRGCAQTLFRGLYPVTGQAFSIDNDFVYVFGKIAKGSTQGFGSDLICLQKDLLLFNQNMPKCARRLFLHEILQREWSKAWRMINQCQFTILPLE